MSVVVAAPTPGVWSAPRPSTSHGCWRRCVARWAHRSKRFVRPRGTRRTTTTRGPAPACPSRPFRAGCAARGCHRLGPLDPPGQFELVHCSAGDRTSPSGFIRRVNSRPSCVTRASALACRPGSSSCAEAGHLDEFPYVSFVHNGTEHPCPGPRLTMRDSSSTLGPRVTVRCLECPASRNIADAAGRDGWESLPACRGRHPHLQRFESCGRPLKLMVLGASNLWFSVTASALHLPQGQTTADIVAAHWELLGQLPNAVLMQSIIDGMDVLRGLRGVPTEEGVGRSREPPFDRRAEHRRTRVRSVASRVATAVASHHRSGGRRLPRHPHRHPTGLRTPHRPGGSGQSTARGAGVAGVHQTDRTGPARLSSPSTG